ncbi:MULTISPECIES: hypothetical protein [Fischerella]|uniref:hypothetical protein n=1 Tax=Fischerella TaxID=1190 RepID=UPI00030F7EF5|nr:MULTISPECIES: hypothetical protein [Fischerella]MBD2434669.1 hypothetical protein [Fischerella sp. FACHB-380]
MLHNAPNQYVLSVLSGKYHHGHPKSLTERSLEPKTDSALSRISEDLVSIKQAFLIVLSISKCVTWKHLT